MKDVDVQRIIENLQDALRVHPDKGYEIGTIEESEKFSMARGLVLEKNSEPLGATGKNFEDPLGAPENKKI